MYYHTRPDGPYLEALKTSFAKCGELAQQHNYNQIGLAVSARGNLDGAISELIGEKAVEILQRDKILHLNTISVRIHLITKRITPRKFSGPVLAAYTSIQQVRELARSSYCKAIVYVPSSEDEASSFEKQFNSQVIY